VTARVFGGLPAAQAPTLGGYVFRRLVLAAAAASLLFAGISAGSASAGAPAPDATGSVNCTVAGKATIKPALYIPQSPPYKGQEGTAPATFGFKMKLTCTGTTGVNDKKGNPVPVSGGSLAMTGTTPNSNALSLATGALPAVTGTIKWKTKGGKVNLTTFSYTSGVATITDPLLFTYPAASGTQTGSYAGEHMTISLSSDLTTADFATFITPDSKGKEKGLKKIPFTGVGGPTTLTITP
jgi:hypothetical protein